MNRHFGKNTISETHGLSSAGEINLRDKLKEPGNLLLCLFVLNALVYLVMGFVVGGWALAGNIVNGQYYLYNGSKTSYTPVSSLVYAYSFWHGLSQPLVFVLFLLLEPKREKRIIL